MVKYIILTIGLLLLPGMSESASWSVEASLTAYLKDHYPWAEVDISELRLSAAQPAEEPSLITVEKTPPGNAAFRLDFPKHKSIHATAYVKVYERVIMSRGACRKGYVLKPEDLYPTLMESGQIPKGAVRDEDSVIGKPLVRSIVPNTAIIEDMVSKTPLVKRGHKVVLCIEAAGFSIKTLGEIKQDAAVGDYVKAVNLNSKRVITGLLEDENTVRVEF
jgi:flagella basal body P-ring formation protein FlgA